MKRFFFLLIPLILLGSCDSDTNKFDLDKDPLKGVIGGKSWAYAVGNAQYTSNTITGLILAEEVQEPCAVRLTSDAHLSVKMPAIRGNHNLPFINNNGHVIFDLAGSSTRYTATSGFIEVVELNGSEVVGYISAEFDDNNHVQGSFLLQVCN